MVDSTRNDLLIQNFPFKVVTEQDGDPIMKGVKYMLIKSFKIYKCVSVQLSFVVIFFFYHLFFIYNPCDIMTLDINIKNYN